MSGCGCHKCVSVQNEFKEAYERGKRDGMKLLIPYLRVKNSDDVCELLKLFGFPDLKEELEKLKGEEK